MFVLTDALNRILNWLLHNDPKAASSLQPGLTRTEINELVKCLPFQLPEEVYELYQWRNGCQPEQEFLIFHRMELLSIQKAIKYSEINRLSEEIYKLYDSHTFPLFYSIPDLTCGEIVIDRDVKNYQIIFSDIKEYGLFKLGYTNLTSMMLTIAECYEEGIYQLIADSEAHHDGSISLL